MENNKEVERMAAHLWTYKEREFLPHGTKKMVMPINNPSGLQTKKKTLIMQMF